jgi:hypothetical protein
MDLLQVVLPPIDLARLVLAYTPATAIEATSIADQVHVVRLLTGKTIAMHVRQERMHLILEQIDVQNPE